MTQHLLLALLVLICMYPNKEEDREDFPIERKKVWEYNNLKSNGEKIACVVHNGRRRGHRLNLAPASGNTKVDRYIKKEWRHRKALAWSYVLTKSVSSDTTVESY